MKGGEKKITKKKALKKTLFKKEKKDNPSPFKKDIIGE